MVNIERNVCVYHEIFINKRWMTVFVRGKTMQKPIILFAFYALLMYM